MQMSLSRVVALTVIGGFPPLATLAQPISIPDGRDTGRLYAQFCANCHGAHLEGGKGASLLPGKLKHGSDDESLRRSIREGYPSGGMPSFAPAFSAAETNGLVAFIREVATREADPQATSSQPLPTGVQSSEEHAYRFETVVEGLDVPWSLSFLPDGRILVTERVGRLRVIENGKLNPEPVADIPRVVVKDEAGLMSVVAAPDLARDPWVYLSFSDPGEGDKAMTKLIRGRLRDNRLVDQQTIFSLPPEKYPSGYVLFGSRLVFDGDYLFFSVGERGQTGEAQKLATPNGKIHRVFRDGKIPPDNPFVSTPGAVPSIWAFGVRNPQGLARDARTGELWESEHGPRGGDELNHIRGGRNYGWPAITYGINYDGTPVSDKTEAPGMEQPVLHWTPSIATSEIEFYTGDRFPKWKNQLFLGSLAQQKFLRIVLDGDRAVHVEELFHNFGRVRDIKTGPDGLLYVALELIGKPGKIIRLVPADRADQPRRTARQP